MNRDVIESYVSGAQRLVQALVGLEAEEMLAIPPADLNIGRWSIHQILIHLADTEGVIADRMKRVIAEEMPPLLAFDENKWACGLYYDDQSAADALAQIALIRRQMARVLMKLPDAAFERFGIHSEAGKKTLAELVQTSERHLNHHLEYVLKKRKWLGK
jgi:uncharacterized damage-inducible protein DinB